MRQVYVHLWVYGKDPHSGVSRCQCNSVKGIYPALHSGLLGEGTSGDVLAQSHLPHSSQLWPSARRSYLYLNLGQCYRFI